MRQYTERQLNIVFYDTSVLSSPISSTGLQIFNNDEFGSVRVVMVDDEPWFVGKDVAEALKYTNPLKAVRDHVDDDDKGMNDLFTPGGSQKTITINESGLYSLIVISPQSAGCRSGS